MIEIHRSGIHKGQYVHVYCLYEDNDKEPCAVFTTPDGQFHTDYVCHLKLTPLPEN